jgi:methylated-DNA-[protein]-cysteine S-methyltransferase
LPPAEPSSLATVTTALERYAAGDVDALDVVPVRQPGTAFQQRVWEAMRSVPPGRPVTYAGLAADVGSLGAARAVGQACSANLAAPFVPCHRVVPAGGGVGGYAYGADVKTRLLAHEREAVAGPPAANPGAAPPPAASPTPGAAATLSADPTPGAT